VGDEDGFGALEVRVAWHHLCLAGGAGGFGEVKQGIDPFVQPVNRRVDAFTDEEAHVGRDLLVTAAPGVELQGEFADRVLEA
jgi:hypothetical protein